MKTQVTMHDFIDTFNHMGRSESFSYDGFRALYDWIEEDDENSGVESEFDVIALDGNFTEYAGLEEFQKNYNKEDYPDIESINDATIVIPVGDDGFIIQNF